jgi:hypothetical protein
MDSKISLGGAVLIALAAFVQLPAQSAQPAPGGKAMTDAVKLRADTAVAVANGNETAAAAINRLKAVDSPSGLKTDHDADFAFAAMDVGQRLVATRKVAEAEMFFQEAEKSLAIVVAKTPDADAANKAMLLQNLAFIRGNYLNKAVQARADIEAAIKLQPDDKNLQRFRDSLAKDQADVFYDKRKG